MYARNAAARPAKPRNNYRQRVPIRARLGLAMRRDMDFGALGDVEQLMQSEGLAMAPISTGDASMTVNGVTVLPTAEVGDIERGEVAGLVLPGGQSDSAGEAKLDKLVAAARARGLPVLAFGEGVAQAARAWGADLAPVADAPGAVFGGDEVTPVRVREQLALVASTLG